MSIETDIKTTLDADVTLNALVSGRNYKGRIQQNPTFPYTFSQRVSTDPVHSLGGSSTQNNTRYQFDCYASTFDGAWAVARALKVAMAAATLFTSLHINSIDGNFSDDAEGYRVIVDFSVWFVE